MEKGKSHAAIVLWTAHWYHRSTGVELLTNTMTAHANNVDKRCKWSGHYNKTQIRTSSSQHLLNIQRHVPDRVTQQTHLEFCTEIPVSFVVHSRMQGSWSESKAGPPYRVRRLRDRPKALRILRVPQWGLCSGIRWRVTQWLERDVSDHWR